jgi:hypothetical protein
MECKTTFRDIDDADEFVDTLIRSKIKFSYAFIRFETDNTHKTIVELYFKDELSLILFNLSYEHDNSK